VPESSLDGINCAEHDDPAPWPSPAEQAEIERFGIFGLEEAEL
jgi:hypothetical protein